MSCWSHLSDIFQFSLYYMSIYVIHKEIRKQIPGGRDEIDSRVIVKVANKKLNIFEKQIMGTSIQKQSTTFGGSKGRKKSIKEVTLGKGMQKDLVFSVVIVKVLSQLLLRLQHIQKQITQSTPRFKIKKHIKISRAILLRKADALGKGINVK